MMIAENQKLTIPLFLIWLLCALSSIVFIEPSPYDLLLMALGMTFFIFGLRVPPNLSAALFLMGLFVIANILASIFASVPMHTIKHMLVTFILVYSWLFFTSVVYIAPERIIHVILHGYVVAAVIGVIFGLIGYLKVTPFYEQFLLYGRIRGSFKDPNVFGAFLVSPAVYLGFQLETAKTGAFLKKLAILLFIILGILISFSRGAWFNLAISSAIYIGLRLVTSKRKTDTAGLIKVASIVASASATILVLAVLTMEDIGKLFSHRAQLVQDYDGESGGRFDVIGNALEISMNYPMGIGPGQGAEALVLEPHNLLIHTMMETGWLGAISFAGFLLLTVRNAFLFCLQPSKIQQVYIVAFACLMGTLLESIIIHSTHWRHLYLLLALIWAPIAAKNKLAITPLTNPV
ncbi:MAG: O-antigen ligase family protein [Methylococcales bacterium]